MRVRGEDHIGVVDFGCFERRSGLRQVRIHVKSNVGETHHEAGAAKHPKACTLKCCDKAGLEIISGSTTYKLDDASVTKAKEYLGKNDSTKVVVKGEEKDGTLTISSIEAQK